MYATTLITALACVATTLAAPQSTDSSSNKQCLDQSTVNTLVNGYTYLLEHPGGPDFNSTAKAILSADQFVVYSDSINTLSQRPVCEVLSNLSRGCSDTNIVLLSLANPHILRATPISRLSSRHRPCRSCKPSKHSSLATRLPGAGRLQASAATCIQLTESSP